MLLHCKRMPVDMQIQRVTQYHPDYMPKQLGKLCAVLLLQCIKRGLKAEESCNLDTQPHSKESTHNGMLYGV